MADPRAETAQVPLGGGQRADTSGELAELAVRIATWARDGEQVEGYVARSRQTSVRVFGGAVEWLSSADSEGVGIRVVSGHRQGFAYAASLDLGLVEDTLAEARDNAAFGTVDEFLGLAEPDGVSPADLDLFRPELARLPTDAKVEMALELERRTRQADARIKGVESADYRDTIFDGAVASSTGILAVSRRSGCSLWSSALAEDGRGTQTGTGWSVGRSPGDLDVDRAAVDAAERATRLLGAAKPASRRLTVLLEPSVTASLLGILSGPLSGMAVLKGRSFLADRLGQEVAVPGFTLVDDPTDPRAYGASRFDAEGLACRPNVLIDKGVLCRFLHNTYTARRTGLRGPNGVTGLRGPNGVTGLRGPNGVTGLRGPNGVTGLRGASTANAVRSGFRSGPGVGSRALTLVPGDRHQAQLLTDVGEGLLVQSVSGLHSGVNATSGDFSVGVEGLMVRNGGLAEPIREATIASTLPQMLAEVVAVGSDREWLPGGAAGCTLAIGGVTLSGS